MSANRPYSQDGDGAAAELAVHQGREPYESDRPDGADIQAEPEELPDMAHGASHEQDKGDAEERDRGKAELRHNERRVAAMVIRPMEKRDIPQVVVMIEQWGEGSLLMMESKPDHAHLEQLVELFLSIPTWCAYVAEVEGEVIGGIAGMSTPALMNADEVLAWEQLWYVRPEYRKGFVALRLLRKLEAWAREQGARGLTVSANHGTDYERVGRFYERLGYRPYETQYKKEI